ncbi:MAG: MFS transporter [Sediminibacterium sp.]|nr:MFS transporter [Sediminibacterium sp.]
MNIRVKIMLCMMMFLNFLVWGLWFVTMGDYLSKGNLGSSGGDVGLAYSTQAWGAIIAPFVMGLIADKYFAAQRLLGVLQICGGIILIVIFNQSQTYSTGDFGSFFILLLAYMILFMPSLGLTNAVALKQVKDSEKEFGFIRMWGTIGWIVAGSILGYILYQRFGVDIINSDTRKNDINFTFMMAGIVSIFYGVFCFFLPDTPPPSKGTSITVRQILGLDAVALLKNKNYLIFFISSILICIPLAFYYSFAGVYLGEINFQNYASKMSYGQISEALFFFIMPWFFKNLKVKKMLFLGMLAWTIRYIFFSYGDSDHLAWMLYGGIILHGICFDFFFVTGYIYTDQTAGPSIRASAQGFITIATYGLGMLVGFFLSGKVVDYYTITNNNITSHNWKAIWQYPAVIALIVLLFFSIFFKPKEHRSV